MTLYFNLKFTLIKMVEKWKSNWNGEMSYLIKKANPDSSNILGSLCFRNVNLALTSIEL